MMSSIPQDQNSDEWKEWRKARIGASEVPIILGLSPYCTAHQLWSRKLGFIPDQPDNPAMRLGREMEPFIRDAVCKNLNEQFTPKVVTHKELEWASASLDGVNDDGSCILEIKCPGLASHQIAEQGRIPDQYYPQLQWQMFVTGIKEALYVSYYHESRELPTSDFEIDPDKMEQVCVLWDESYFLETVLNPVVEFYRQLTDLEEPPLGENDFVQIDDPVFEQYAREWKAAKEMLDFYKDKETYFKNKLISMSDDSNCKGYGVSLKRVSRDGAVNWNKLYADLTSRFPEVAKELVPDDYRKESIGYWKISAEM